MYGDASGSLMVKIVVLQCIIWYTLMLFLFEYRGARTLIGEQFPDTAGSIISFRVDSDIISLDGREPLQTVDTFPSEIDEVAVFSSEYSINDGQMIFKASLCCEDRPGLLKEIVEVLKSLHLKTLRAEMVTLGGRMRNVFIAAADKDQSIESVHFLENALKSLLERSNNDTKGLNGEGY